MFLVYGILKYSTQVKLVMSITNEDEEESSSGNDLIDKNNSQPPIFLHGKIVHMEKISLTFWSDFFSICFNHDRECIRITIPTTVRQKSHQ